MAEKTETSPRRKAASTSSRRGVQSISVGASLLRVMAASNGPLHLREIAAAAKMPPQKAHRYLLSLVGAELAEQDPVTGRYDLGGMSLRLGLAALSRRSSLRLITQAALEFGSAEDVTVGVAIWGDQGPSFIAWQNGSLAPLCNYGAGSIVQLLRSATGRLFLAHMPRNLTRVLVDRELAGIAAYVPNAKMRTWEDVEHLIDTVRTERVGSTHEDLVPGVSAVAAPVFDHQGALVAAIMQMGPSGQIYSPERPASRKLLELADRLSLRLGFTPERPFVAEREVSL